MTKEDLSRLSDHVDQFVQLEIGERLPYVGLLLNRQGQLAIFTNRRSNDEVIAILEEALHGVRSNAEPKWNPRE